MPENIPGVIEIDGSNLADATRKLLTAFEAFLSVDWSEADREIYNTTREYLQKATKDAIEVWKLVHAAPIAEKSERIH